MSDVETRERRDSTVPPAVTQQYLSRRFEGERPRRAAPDHVAVVVVRASQWSSWCGGSWWQLRVMCG